ncbi:hypothetical protein PIB30_070605 [Stylosanthes scabra]|uniref:Uncharacterized protein n=1 Tax=Stylosanthes scabra TaxID=79078 RepID=A0ABU6SNN2_9FABA|nr:hypothetical protein [Stylosanthes scabra]
MFVTWLIGFGVLQAPGPVYPVPRTPMCDARRYRSLFPRRRIAPPTPPPPSPPPSDEEPSTETYDPVSKLVGDPDEPYVAEHVPYGAPKAYYSDASYGLERESASTNTAPSSHHSPGSSSDGASNDDLVNRCDHDIPKVGVLHQAEPELVPSAEEEEGQLGDHEWRFVRSSDGDVVLASLVAKKTPKKLKGGSNRKCWKPLKPGTNLIGRNLSTRLLRF